MSSETKSKELLSNMLETRQSSTTEDVLNIFDSLEPVDKEFMHGLWKGSEVATGHPMDGLMEAVNWFGKWFKDNEVVHPLVHTGPFGKLFSVTPDPFGMWLLVSFPILRHLIYPPILRALVWLRSTTRGSARLRMVEYRGKVTATMIYDKAPILDHFRKINENQVLGIMEHKDFRPYAFLMTRSTPTTSFSKKLK